MLRGVDGATQLERDVVQLRREITTLGSNITPGDRRRLEKRAADVRARASEYLYDRMIAEKEPVMSRGGPASSAEVQRGLQEARSRLRRGACSVCPAATMTGAGVLCGVERSVFTEKSDPMTLLSFCMGTYQSCPSWQTAREMDWAGKGKQFQRELVGA